jgi:hypothetical protein
MYTLDLSEVDCRAINFVGFRYFWSDMLIELGCSEPGCHILAEHEAWELSEAVEADTIGGHDRFPMLRAESALYRKLSDLLESIV